MANTMFGKIWDAHVVEQRPDGTALLYVDRHLVHDATAQAFDLLHDENLRVRRPDLTFGMADHYVATHLDPLREPHLDAMVTALKTNTEQHDITSFGMNHAYQGIVHVAGPELGLTQPGMLMVCGDSHTSTHGALGALAFGIGASEVAHTLATQCLWQKKPKTMVINVEGELPPHVAAKDLILHIIGAIGANGGTGYVIEYSGSAVKALSMEARLTLCNMSIEAGARAGMVAPDATTFDYLANKPYAPKGELFEQAVAYWQSICSDPDAHFDKQLTINANDIAPTVTWGTSPETALPITDCTPQPDHADNSKRAAIEGMLDYMALSPGQSIKGLPIDRVFIGSCTNSRIEDLRAAAEIAKKGHAKVPTVVVPGSWQVRKEAEKEGLDKIFQAAGFDWREPGCSMCVAMNGDHVPPHERCASTSNRNFAGRQGRDSRTHLMSPAMAAAASIHGCITDVRDL